MSDDKPIRCFMDGIDWQHHLNADISGTQLYPDEESLRDAHQCIATGGCGVVEVEVRLVRWVEPQNLKFVEGRPMTGHFDSLTPEQQTAALNNRDTDI